MALIVSLQQVDNFLCDLMSILRNLHRRLVASHLQALCADRRRHHRFSQCHRLKHFTAHATPNSHGRQHYCCTFKKRFDSGHITRHRNILTDEGSHRFRRIRTDEG